MRKRILITNDDGIQARGIRALAAALSAYSDVYIAAPDTQKSACGHSITIGRPFAVQWVDFPAAKAALRIDGTPADCVKLGLDLMKRQQDIEIDMVFAGINHGGNLGTDTLYSGTVGGAMEGCFCGKPAVAVSVNNHDPEDFSYACELAVKTLLAAGDKIRRGTVININVPDIPREQIKGVKYTRLGLREYDEWFETGRDEAGRQYYKYNGNPVVYDSLDLGIDVIATQEGWATITPLHYDITQHSRIKEVAGWGIEEVTL